MPKNIDLNADMGESFGVYTLGADADMLRIVTTANVACGFHAGDPLVMHRTAEMAKANGVAIGAHPSFRDLWGFGRRPIIGENPSDLEKEIVYQIGAMQAIAAAVGHPITHVKTHGAMGNLAAVDAGLAMAVAKAVAAVDRKLVLVTLPGNEIEHAGERLGLTLAREVYADRTYDDDGNLTSRKKEGAVIHDPAVACRRVLRMIEEQAITSVNGRKIPVRIDTICVHGDNPAAVSMAQAVRSALEEAGVTVQPFARSFGLMA
jgi:5-oxoprolinase (ATP-hydrolysing) subunit A